MTLTEEIVLFLRKKKFDVYEEKITQTEIAALLAERFPDVEILKEHIFDKENRIDFFLPVDGIGIEVKTKGQKRAIYTQCERYCELDQVKKLILVSSQSMGFPKELNGKDCYVVNMSDAWL